MTLKSLWLLLALHIAFLQTVYNILLLRFQTIISDQNCVNQANTNEGYIFLFTWDFPEFHEKVFQLH